MTLWPGIMKVEAAVLISLLGRMLQLAVAERAAEQASTVSAGGVHLRRAPVPLREELKPFFCGKSNKGGASNRKPRFAFCLAKRGKFMNYGGTYFCFYGSAAVVTGVTLNLSLSP